MRLCGSTNTALTSAAVKAMTIAKRPLLVNLRAVPKHKSLYETTLLRPHVMPPVRCNPCGPRGRRCARFEHRGSSAGLCAAWHRWKDAPALRLQGRQGSDDFLYVQ